MSLRDLSGVPLGLGAAGTMLCDRPIGSRINPREFLALALGLNNKSDARARAGGVNRY
jgi:hypothetical protein